MPILVQLQGIDMPLGGEPINSLRYAMAVHQHGEECAR
jgi:hypothetical protein